MSTTLGRPSSLIHEICIEKVDRWNLFKFSESLQMRMENLLEKKKADQLTPEEVAELDAIGELDRIFTHINAMVAASPSQDPCLSAPLPKGEGLLPRGDAGGERASL